MCYSTHSAQTIYYTCSEGLRTRFGITSLRISIVFPRLKCYSAELLIHTTHRCTNMNDQDINEQLEDYYAILTQPDEDSAGSSTWPLVSDSAATTIRMAFREPLSIA